MPSLVKLSLIAIASVQVHAATSSAKTCYYPDGKTVDDTGVPCNSNGQFSSCCGHSDACMSHGYCYSPFTGYFYRRSCTDQKWASDVCPDGCKDEVPNTGVPILQCDHRGNACCAIDEKPCCNSSQSFPFFAAAIVVPTLSPVPPPASSSSPSSSTNLRPSSSSNTSPVSTKSASAASSNAVTSSSHSNATTVGLAVGVPLGVALIALVGTLIFLLRRRQLSPLGEAASTSINGHTSPSNALSYDHAMQQNSTSGAFSHAAQITTQGTRDFHGNDPVKYPRELDEGRPRTPELDSYGHR